MGFGTTRQHFHRPRMTSRKHRPDSERKGKQASDVPKIGLCTVSGLTWTWDRPDSERKGKQASDVPKMNVPETDR
jgi:hypothetical protein